MVAIIIAKVIALEIIMIVKLLQTIKNVEIQWVLMNVHRIFRIIIVAIPIIILIIIIIVIVIKLLDLHRII